MVLQSDAIEAPFLGSLKNHFLKEFFKEPIKVSQRTFNKWFFKAPFLVPQRTFQTRVLSENHFP